MIRRNILLFSYVVCCLLLAACQRQVATETKDDMSAQADSFVVVYRQLVNGYRVKAVVKTGEYGVNEANMTFTKDGESFTLNTTSFGDSVFNKGGWGMDGTNDKLIEKYRGKTVEADYHKYRYEDNTMFDDTPFFFLDLDFDGLEELVIVHLSMAVRNHSGYDVYRIVGRKPVLIDYPPYRSGCYSYLGMTDYPTFDYHLKTIDCPYPEGELRWDGHTIYGISKTRKDTVVVNGRSYLFNHLEVIEDVKFEE